MSTQARAAAPAPSSTAIPGRARGLAARLDELFATDQEIVVRLNGAHHQLAAANDRLLSATAVDAFAVHEQIRLAFHAYQHAAEQRRQLAVDVGELSQQLADTLTTAGVSPELARSANVHALA